MRKKNLTVHMIMSQKKSNKNTPINYQRFTTIQLRTSCCHSDIRYVNLGRFL